jgi:hypothetical protein
MTAMAVVRRELPVEARISATGAISYFYRRPPTCMIPWNRPMSRLAEFRALELKLQA